MAGMTSAHRIQILLTARGADKVATDVEKVSKEIEDLDKKTQGASLATTNMFLALQAATSGLNQLSGGANKVVSGLEAMGWATAEQTRQLQIMVRQFELLTGTLEIGIAFVNIYTGSKELLAVANAKAAASENTLTTSIILNSKAIMAHPLFRLGAVLVAVVATLYLLEKHTQAISGSLQKMGDAVHYVSDGIHGLLGGLASVDKLLVNMMRPGVLAGPATLSVESIRTVGGLG